MKYLTLLAILTIITGCSLQNSSAFSVDQINQCVSENETSGFENAVKICQSKCNSDIPCQQRVSVIAKEKFGQKTAANKTEDNSAAGTQNLAPNENSGKTDPTPPAITEKETTQNETQNYDIESKDETAEQPVSSETEEQTQQNGLVTLAGFSCDNKDGLPDKMKIFAERVDIKKWHWIVPYGGAWELTELEPGQYKIYYAPERNTQPLAKYSELIADGNGSHDYKILDLTNGGEVRNIKPCDWE